MPLTAKDVAQRLLKVADPQRNDIAKAKRRLDAAVKEGRVRRVDTDPGEPGLWTLAEGVHAEGARGCMQGVHGEGARSALRSRGACTPAHDEGDGGARDNANGYGDWTDEQLQALVDSAEEPKG